jgi:hypothetical protein
MRPLSILFILVILGLAAQAQEPPRVELFAGYSVDVAGFPIRNGAQTLGNVRGTLQGWNGSAAINFNRWAGLVADVSGYYGSATGSKDITVLPPNCFIGCTGPVTATLRNVNTYTFGPQISKRQDQLTVFARALFGVAHTREDIKSFASLLPPTPAENKYAMILDGGADIGLSPYVAIRLQPGYLMTHILENRQSSFRFSTGVVFRLGR